MNPRNFVLVCLASVSVSVLGCDFGVNERNANDTADSAVFVDDSAALDTDNVDDTAKDTDTNTETDSNGDTGSADTDTDDTNDTDTQDTDAPPTDSDGDGQTTLVDCNDANPDVFVGAEESCNGIDDNCDDVIDEGCGGDTDEPDTDTEDTDTVTDTDGDGYTSIIDCDDNNAAVHPGAAESCNDIDDDCDNSVDEGCPVDDTDEPVETGDTGEPIDTDDIDTDVPDTDIPVADADNDGDPDATDCNDADPTVHHGATEILYDGIDQDCNGSDGFIDADSDGYTSAVDCDDADPTIHPNATEYCNGADDDCDGSVDENAAADADTWYIDSDGDGYGGSTINRACSQPTGYVSTSTDCNDSSATAHPGAIELCDSIDNDCDGTVDEGTPTWYADADGDGYGSTAAITACSAPTGYVSTGGDCNDSAATAHPGATEIRDSLDNDCDGQVDEGLPITHRLCVVSSTVTEFDAAVMIDGDPTNYVNYSGGSAYVASPFLTEADADGCADFEGGSLMVNGYSPQSRLWGHYIVGLGTTNVAVTDGIVGSVLGLEVDGEPMWFTTSYDLEWRE